MRFRPNDETISPSLLDRLTDLDPDRASDAAGGEWEAVRDLKAAICRDLAALLNTRRKETVVDAAFEQASNSVLTYGIPDFTSYTLTNGVEQELVRRSIERAIRQFEPRLASVVVNIDDTSAGKLALQFQVDAVMKRPRGEPVQFDVSLHRDSRRIAVSGADR